MEELEKPQDERGAARRFTAKLALLGSEHRRLAERLAAIESSTAWAVARRLSRLRQRLAPDASRRQRAFRLLVRALRLWRREGMATLLRRTAAKLRYRRTGKQAQKEHVAVVGRAEPRSLAPIAPRTCEFRVAFIGSSVATEAPSMRYRAHNVIEALDLAELEGTFFALENVRANLPVILSHDLIVLVRAMHNDRVAELIAAARQRSLPLVFDLDDYLFDAWVMPYVEAMHYGMSQAEALRIFDAFAVSLDRCDYFSGSTSYLAAKAAEWGKESFVIRNGLNAAQLRLSRLALEQRSIPGRGHGTRIGYFSGTRTHQADFRVVYPALMRLLHERADVRLRIVGQLDVGEFPGLAPVLDQIELLPIRPWSELPAVITGVDVNLIPLELTPFNEGKSNLKYYEAGLLKVPSIASPTRIHVENITPGHNGLLARTPEEWYNALKELVARPDRRARMGQNAFEHAMKIYTPAAVAAEAVAVYRQILQLHRSRRIAA